MLNIEAPEEPAQWRFSLNNVHICADKVVQQFSSQKAKTHFIRQMFYFTFFLSLLICIIFPQTYITWICGYLRLQFKK